jgi:hypothetical protein
MTKDRAFEGETLVVDILLSKNRITNVERAMYELHLANAKFVRGQIDLAISPTPNEITLIFRQVIGFGISQKTLAEWFGVTPGTLSRWVTGENPPREFMRQPILQRLGEAVNYIIARLEGYAKQPPFRSNHRSRARPK